MKRIVVAIMALMIMTIPARAEVIAEIHTGNGMENAIEISEPCPAVSVETTADAPEESETAETLYGGIVITDEEYSLLRSILALEADYATEGHDGQKAVVEVILNRVLSDEWPNTVSEVIYQKGQFATVKYLKKPYNLPGEHEDDAISAVLRETETVLPDMRYVYFSRGKSNGRDFVKLNHHWFSR